MWAVALTPLSAPIGAFVIQAGCALLEEGRLAGAIPTMRVTSASAWSGCVPSAQRLHRIVGRALFVLGGLLGLGPLTIALNQLVATPPLLALGFPKNQWLLWVDLR